MPGKIPMWGNPKRERDLYRLRKVHINNNNTISSKRKLEMVAPPRVGGSEKFQKPAKVR
jgi:hypothetical protein